jgi:tRNA U55 pseudouridine synthase TruB
VGRFTIDDAVPLSELESLGEAAIDSGYSMFDALSDWEAVRLGEPDADRVMCGGDVELKGDDLGRASEGDHVRLTRDGETLLAVGLVGALEGENCARVRPVRVFETMP